jgi:hypothetical protein
MSGNPRIQGPLSAVGIPLAGGLQLHAASSPFKQCVAYASWGAILLGFYGYGYTVAMIDVSTLPGPWLLGFAGAAGVGLLLLGVGVRGSRGPRNTTMALSSVALPAGLFRTAPLGRPRTDSKRR